MELDYQIGEDLKDRVRGMILNFSFPCPNFWHSLDLPMQITPRAIDFFTGKALRYEDGVGEDFSDDYDDDDDDDDDVSKTVCLSFFVHSNGSPSHRCLVNSRMMTMKKMAVLGSPALRKLKRLQYHRLALLLQATKTRRFVAALECFQKPRDTNEPCRPEGMQAAMSYSISQVSDAV